MATRVDIDSTSDPLQGLLAIPESGMGPGVIVIQEWWGLVPQIERVVDRFAEAGFTAIAPDHYRGVRASEPDQAGKLMMGLKVSAAASDIASAADYLVRSGHVPGDKVGVIGFCMGGGLALLAPTVSPHIDCASAFYPAMPWPDYHPEWANYAGREALVHQAESDIPNTGADIARYAEAIAANGGTATVVDYPGSHHAFFNEHRPEVYDETMAQVAWDATLAMFHRRLTNPFA
ncbi:MAG: dienelactone hydrolase family protein [Candidatus Nanopelagicales bacterium]